MTNDERPTTNPRQSLGWLILVKHSLPEIVPGVPANEWSLSEEGQRRCRPLARKLDAYQPAALVSSVEPKAVETAGLIAAHLGTKYITADGLHEHKRHNFPYLDAEQFERAVAKFFRQPNKLVLGEETATEALERFTRAVHDVLTQLSADSVIIVAHGTVITLFTAAHAGVDAFPFWKQLGLPSYVVFSLPKFGLSATVTTVTNGD